MLTFPSSSYSASSSSLFNFHTTLFLPSSPSSPCSVKIGLFGLVYECKCFPVLPPSSFSPSPRSSFPSLYTQRKRRRLRRRMVYRGGWCALLFTFIMYHLFSRLFLATYMFNSCFPAPLPVFLHIPPPSPPPFPPSPTAAGPHGEGRRGGGGGGGKGRSRGRR